jgi:hypothetical protein
MKCLIAILTLSCTAITSSGQVENEREQFVLNSNLPDILYNFYSQDKIKTSHKINTDLNPFYLRGDFDGNKKLITLWL